VSTLFAERLPATLELVAKRADKLALGVEDENGRVILQIRAPLVDDVEQTLAIHGDVVRGLPRILVRELRPVVQHFVTVLALADDELGVGLLRRHHPRCEQGGGGGGEETAAGGFGCLHGLLGLI
jgi:hypothetical protein